MIQSIIARLRPVLLAGLVAFVLLAGVIPAELAEAASSAVMTDPPFAAQATEALNVRAGPSTSSAVVGLLTAGQRFTVVDEVPGEAVLADNVVWFRISSGGFVYSGFTAPAEGVSNATASGRWIEVDRSAQIARAFVNGRVVYTAGVTTGVPAFPTPVGTFAIQRRVLDETMDSRTIGIPLSSPLGYFLEHVLYTQYFTDGVALHDNYWSPAAAFGGYPTSHGCVGMRRADALFFWNFATIGTPVIVHD
jgi:lipoprotein-anchoring transpeptidase ErfK/SrfK